MRLVYRSVPATESQPEKIKKGMHHISYFFLRFWIRYVHPYQNALDLGMADGILAQRVRPTFEQFVSYAFEEAARSYVTRLARKGQLSFLPERIGSWWDQGRLPSSEIDVLAISDSERALLVGECKWSANPAGSDMLQNLKRKTQLLQASKSWDRITYFLFAKSGFTPALKEQATKEEVQLISVEDCLR